MENVWEQFQTIDENALKEIFENYLVKKTEDEGKLARCTFSQC